MLVKKQYLFLKQPMKFWNFVVGIGILLTPIFIRMEMVPNTIPEIPKQSSPLKTVKRYVASLVLTQSFTTSSAFSLSIKRRDGSSQSPGKREV